MDALGQLWLPLYVALWRADPMSERRTGGQPQPPELWPSETYEMCWSRLRAQVFDGHNRKGGLDLDELDREIAFLQNEVANAVGGSPEQHRSWLRCVDALVEAAEIVAEARRVARRNGRFSGRSDD